MTDKAQPEGRHLPARSGPAAEPEKPEGGYVTLSEADPGNPFRVCGGSRSRHFNSALLRETLGAIWTCSDAGEDKERFQSAAAVALAAFQPKDEIEGMLAAQAVAMHFSSMECFRRTMIPDQASDTAARLRKDGANLARGMADMLDALDRKRGKAPQVVRVERVVVQDGGQAIVGNVAGGTAPSATGGGQ